MASGGDGGTFDGSSSANTKQIMRLMDSLKTLGDENAALMREVEELEAARAETRAAREEMKRFKDEYGKRFKTLKRALEKFRQENNGPGNGANRNDPVNSSDYIKSASVAEQLQRQEALIRKLTADLKMSKEESKKKDSALRKYESFYREVKARSAQKAAQRNQLQQQPPPTHPQSQQRRNVGTSSRR
jgi:chromosome segregation ATPase